MRLETLYVVESLFQLDHENEPSPIPLSIAVTVPSNGFISPLTDTTPEHNAIAI